MFDGVRGVPIRWIGTALVMIFALGACAQSEDSEKIENGGGNISLDIVSPAMGEVLSGPSVTVKFDLQNYEVYMDEETGKGQHIHVILDNQPYIPHYSTDPFTFEEVAPGTHTIRAFPSREWHESIKDEDAFAMVTFHVGEEDGENVPDRMAPLLTYSRPKGEYAGEDGKRVMVDYWVRNCSLSEADYRVRMRVDGSAQDFILWEPYWLEDLTPGEHEITLELIDPERFPVEGVFNTTTRTFTVTP